MTIICNSLTQNIKVKSSGKLYLKSGCIAYTSKGVLKTEQILKQTYFSIPQLDQLDVKIVFKQEVKILVHIDKPNIMQLLNTVHNIKLFFRRIVIDVYTKLEDSIFDISFSKSIKMFFFTYCFTLFSQNMHFNFNVKNDGKFLYKNELVQVQGIKHELVHIIIMNSHDDDKEYLS
ncbi:hypothetical protein AGLY_018129 [Aphis glycines]|uniref:Uncharacterized protein n=1 Tax=Aphis glycines TaxID=307491 RepID=A0A6G0SU29_APHGL|nr:hypothetical protein AGLY_018129 [Aphis glycines]